MITVTDLKYISDYPYFHQWEGMTDDGRYVYVRYRHDWLTINVAANMKDAISGDHEDTEIYSKDPGPLPLTYGRLRGLTRHLIHWPPTGA